MRQLLTTLLITVLFTAAGSGQGHDYSSGHGYVYFAPSVSSPGSVTFAHVGGGGEGFFNRYIGAGAELGYLTPIRSWSDGVGTLSPNVVARLRAKDSANKVEPFITGGYTLFFRSGAASGFNFGGGVNYWMKNHIGLRFEVRDNVWTSYATIHYVGIRVSMLFR